MVGARLFGRTWIRYSHIPSVEITSRYSPPLRARTDSHATRPPLPRASFSSLCLNVFRTVCRLYVSRTSLLYCIVMFLATRVICFLFSLLFFTLCTSMRAVGPPTRALLELYTVFGHAALRRARLRYPPSAFPFFPSGDRIRLSASVALRARVEHI